MEREAYLAKSKESLGGAQREFTAKGYNNAANRAYYAAFQAAVAALVDAGMEVRREAGGVISHGSLHGAFAGMIDRRKLYPSELRSVLPRLIDDRLRADYKVVAVSDKRAARGVARARELVEVVEKHIGSGGQGGR